jgi:hypothetical protein
MKFKELEWSRAMDKKLHELSTHSGDAESIDILAELCYLDLKWQLISIIAARNERKKAKIAAKSKSKGKKKRSSSQSSSQSKSRKGKGKGKGKDDDEEDDEESKEELEEDDDDDDEISERELKKLQPQRDQLAERLETILGGSGFTMATKDHVFRLTADYFVVFAPRADFSLPVPKVFITMLHIRQCSSHRL